MILTITMNPSVDIAYRIPAFALDQVNRCNEVRKTAGGKGLNVTRVIQQLREPVIATGILGGTLGDFIQKQLTNQGIQHQFHEILQESRNCIAILHAGQQTEILEAGPRLESADGADYLALLKLLLEEQLPQVVTLSGSLPQGLPADFYQEILSLCQRYEIPVIADCSGVALQKCLEHQAAPFMIKPNQQELSQLLGTEVTLENLREAISAPLFARVKWIVVSLGSQGAFVKCGKAFYRVSIPKISVKNPVGSGDATVAGLAVALCRKYSTEKTLQLAMTTGMLNTMEEQTGYIDAREVENWLEQVTVEKI